MQILWFSIYKYEGMFVFHNLKLFVDIVENGSIIAVAKNTHTHYSTLNARVKRLEEQAGHKFFERTTRGLRPTAKGLIFYSFCQDVLARYALYEKDMGYFSNTLTICAGGYFNEYFTHRILPIFLQGNPNVELTFCTKVSDEVGSTLKYRTGC
jgi:Transcriptional regulator